MNRNPAQRSRQRVTFKRKLPLLYTNRNVRRRTSLFQFPRVTQSQETVGTASTVRSRSSLRSVQTAAIPRPWKRSEFGLSTASVNVCTYSVNQTGFPALATIDSRTLDGVELTSMLGRTSNAQVNQRRTNCIHLLGIKVFFDVFNQVDQIINFEYAVVSPKNSATVDAINFLTADGEPQRGKSVDSKAAIDLKSAKVNPDENFIFSHKRFQLLHQPPATGGHTDYTTNIKYGSSVKQGYEYIPINRKISYDSMTTATPTDPIYLSFWCYGMKELGAAAKINGAVLYQFRAVLLYKNVET